jgi:hypothetical protein
MRLDEFADKPEARRTFLEALGISLGMNRDQAIKAADAVLKEERLSGAGAIAMWFLTAGANTDTPIRDIFKLQLLEAFKSPAGVRILRDYALDHWLYYLRFEPLTTDDQVDRMPWLQELTQRIGERWDGNINAFWEHVNQAYHQAT